MKRTQNNALRIQKETNSVNVYLKHNDQCAIVIETDDLIIEYCARKEAIINLCIKDGEEENQYFRMLKPEWPDDTLRTGEGL